LKILTKNLRHTFIRTYNVIHICLTPKFLIVSCFFNSGLHWWHWIKLSLFMQYIILSYIFSYIFLPQCTAWTKLMLTPPHHYSAGDRKEGWSRFSSFTCTVTHNWQKNLVMIFKNENWTLELKGFLDMIMITTLRPPPKLNKLWETNNLFVTCIIFRKIYRRFLKSSCKNPCNNLFVTCINILFAFSLFLSLSLYNKNLIV
jgi:hypothetical protein